MNDNEGGVGDLAWRKEQRAGLVLVADLLEEAIICACSKRAAAVDETENSCLARLEEIDDGLVVTEVRRTAEMQQPFGGKHLLFFLEDVADVELVQLLVSVVDHKLLKGVDLEDLEAVDVQQPDGEGFAAFLARCDRLVHAEHQPIEELFIKLFGQRITTVIALSEVKRRLRSFDHTFRQ